MDGTVSDEPPSCKHAVSTPKPNPPPKDPIVIYIVVGVLSGLLVFVAIHAAIWFYLRGRRLARQFKPTTLPAPSSSTVAMVTDNDDL